MVSPHSWKRSSRNAKVTRAIHKVLSKYPSWNAWSHSTLPKCHKQPLPPSPSYARQQLEKQTSSNQQLSTTRKQARSKAAGTSK